MKRVYLLITILILNGLILSGCWQAVSPSPAAETIPPAIKEAKPVLKADWEQKWESVLAEAKKEGSVRVYSIWRPENRLALSQAFKEKYGIEVEFAPFGRGPEVLARVQAEKRAGLYLADAFGAGNPSLVATFKPEGVLGPIKPLLILPEVLDVNAWQGKKLPFTDQDGLALSMVAIALKTVLYNTEMIKEGEITVYKDLLKPQYKGKITLFDPSITGAANAIMANLDLNLWGEAETADFLRKLLKEQEPVMQRDTRLHAETVARGKYAIGIFPLVDLVAEFIALGAPIKFAVVKEDNHLTASSGALGVPTKFAHPNAAIVFVNWLLTREGQSVFAKSRVQPSTRLDASTEGIYPLFIPTPGEKYYPETEEFLAYTGKWLELSKKIIAESVK